LEKLIPYSNDAIQTGVDLTISHWDKPNLMPPIAYILARIEDGFDAIRRRQLEAHSRELLTREAHHPDFAGMSDEHRHRQFQRMLLESKAAGKFGPDAVEPAKAALAAMDRAETVSAPSTLGDAIRTAARAASVHIGPSGRDAKRAAGNDQDQDDSDGGMAFRE
jgi:hypothetical protein